MAMPSPAASADEAMIKKIVERRAGLVRGHHRGCEKKRDQDLFDDIAEQVPGHGSLDVRPVYPH